MINARSILRLSPFATFSDRSVIQVIDDSLLNIKRSHAQDSQRKREIHIINSSNEDSTQRMINAIEPGSYIRPHKHGDGLNRQETVIILKGSIGLILFDESGTVMSDEQFILDQSRGCYAADWQGSAWHTMISLESGTILFEIKPGPYSQSMDKYFSDWAPEENSDASEEYLQLLEDNFRQKCNLPCRKW